ncbi:MAG: cell division protein ZapB [Vibrionaceae bacterium]
MSLEILEQLEDKVQVAVDTISLLQLEIEELKEQNSALKMASQNAVQTKETLEAENQKMRAEQEAWQQRIRSLLGKIEEVE